MPESGLALSNPLLTWQSPFGHPIWVSTRPTSIEIATEGLPTVIRMDQTHSANIHIADQPVLPGHHVINNTDAVISNQPATIAVKTADCLPILIAHSSGWIGGIHAGRAGTTAGITINTLSALIQKTGTQTGYWIFLGPRICVACYEIDPIAHTHYDLVEENISQINSCLDKNKTTIVDSGYCTACQNDLFFSYRKEKTTQRIWSGIGHH